MKFRKKKKATMRMHRIARIKRAFNAYLSGWTDWNTDKVYEIVDKAMFRDQYYLLVKAPDGYGIYKMVSEIISESVKLSNEKLLKDRKTFESPSLWKRKSAIKMSDFGDLIKVEVAKHEKPLFNGGKVVIRIFDLY